MQVRIELDNNDVDSLLAMLRKTTLHIIVSLRTAREYFSIFVKELRDIPAKCFAPMDVAPFPKERILTENTWNNMHRQCPAGVKKILIWSLENNKPVAFALGGHEYKVPSKDVGHAQTFFCKGWFITMESIVDAFASVGIETQNFVSLQVKSNADLLFHVDVEKLAETCIDEAQDAKLLSVNKHMASFTTEPMSADRDYSVFVRANAYGKIRFRANVRFVDLMLLSRKLEKIHYKQRKWYWKNYQWLFRYARVPDRGDGE
jgi:hypothetical protein